MKQQEWLNDLVGEGKSPEVLARSLEATLREARSRRIRRRMFRACTAVACLALASWISWMNLGRHPAPANLSPNLVTAVPPATSPAWRITTRAVPDHILRSTAGRGEPWRLTTNHRLQVELMSDQELLAAVPGCGALARTDRSLRFVALCENLISNP